MREDKKLEKAYFYKPPFCRALDKDKDTKTAFNRDAIRISPKAKVTSLMQSSKDLIKIMKHNFSVNSKLEKIPVLMVLADNIALLRDVAFLFAITINIMVLLSFKYYSEDKDAKSENRYTEGTITAFGTVLIVLAGIIVAYNLLKSAPILISKAWVKKQDELNKIILLKFFLLIKKFVMSFFYLLTDFYVLYYIIYAVTAIIGLAISPFFFFFHLFDVLVRYPVLLNVVKAVWIPKK